MDLNDSTALSQIITIFKLSIDFDNALRWRHMTLRWRHNGRDSVSNHQPHGCLLNRLFRRRSKKTSKLRVTGLCAGNSPGTGEFPAQMASYAENVSIWWRHHGFSNHLYSTVCLTFVQTNPMLRTSDTENISIPGCDHGRDKALSRQRDIWTMFEDIN